MHFLYECLEEFVSRLGSYMSIMYLANISLSLIAGEQHGFRKAENIKFALDGEFYFFSKVFGFDAPGIDVDVSLKCNLTSFP